MKDDKPGSFTLGEWTIHPALNRITSSTGSRTIEGKVMSVLVELSRHPSEVVLKNDLLDSVWPNQSVADGVLTRAIHELRVALADDATNPKFIETVPRRGYRLLLIPGRPADTTPVRVPIPYQVMFLLLCALGIGYWISADSDVATDRRSQASIAVLPFTNLTGTPGNEYIGDGIAEAVIHAIAQQPGLDVIARTSSFAMRDNGMTAPEIGARLQVDKLVEGSIREENGRQRITIQLIDARTGMHDGSTTVDVVGGDLFAAQVGIARTVVTMLEQYGVEIDEEATVTVTPSAPEAFDLFLKGRAALQTRSAESLNNARTFFNAALEIDPEFAPAHAGLAQLYVISRTYLQLSGERAFDLAMQSANRALEIDPRNADALTVAAAVATDRGDYERGFALFERAIRAQPSNAQAHQWYGEAQALPGYVAESRRRIERALHLNPLAGSTNSVRAKAAAYFIDDPMLYEGGRQGDALGAILSSRLLTLHYFRIGDVDGFRRELGRYHEVVGVDPQAAELLAAGMSGEIPLEEMLEELAPIGEPRDGFFARELAMLGLEHAAIDAMIRGGSTDSSFLDDVWLPEFRSARQTDEFLQFIRYRGLDMVWQAHGLPDACMAVEPEPFCAQVTD